MSVQSQTQIMTLGGGCFWCLDAVYVNVLGVLDVESGYSNGHLLQPSYEQVCSGNTGHNEVVRLAFDPQVINLREILEIFFVIHDPTTLNAQGNDRGTQYRSGIYFSSPAQQEVALKVMAELANNGVHAVTEVLPIANYWPAEDYHQNYFAQHPQQGYCLAVAAPKVAKFRKTFAHLQRI